MKIHHVAIWVKDLEGMRNFYLKYFDCQSGERYENPTKGFSSFFIRFDDRACIELMHRNDISKNSSWDAFGWTHLAIQVGSKAEVDRMTRRFEEDGLTIESLPRVTGDGYYESVILDPEGNRIELVGK
jgi:Lactoylglutathione lyase and related lyases